ncbi:MAG: STAS domain-containing protein [Fusobacteria bacterium]|nr:STAS domain-containing protein [Fusobacteriota bacterium]
MGLKNDISINIREPEVTKIKIVTVEGELEMFTSIKLKKYIDDIVDSGTNRIILDFYAMNYINSLGLGILTEILKKIKQNGGILVFINLSSEVKKIFEITKLVKFFKIFNSEKEAVSYLSSL